MGGFLTRSLRLTWEKFDKLYGELLTHCMVDDERMRHETVEAVSFKGIAPWPGHCAGRLQEGPRLLL